MDMKIVIGASVGAAIDGFKKVIATGRTVGSKVRAALSTALSPLATLTGIGLNIMAVQKIFGMLDNIGKGADRIQITTKAYQELQYAASKTSTNMERVEQSVGKSVDLYRKAAAGDAAAMKTLDKIGLNWKELAGLAPDQVFERIAAALNKIDDPGKKFTLAAGIFERENAQKMMPFVDGLSKLRKEANDLNMIIADETVRAAERAGDAFTRMGEKLAAAAAKSGLVDYLENVLENLDDIINNTVNVNAAKMGVYDRPHAVNLAIAEAEKSGKYSPDQIAEAKKYSEGYGSGANAGIFAGGEGYALIDKMLKDAGLGAIARTSTKISPFSQFSGSAYSAARTISPQDASADKEQKDLEKYLQSFTSTAKTAEGAIAELKKGVSDKIGIMLDDKSIDMISAKIDEIKGKYQAMDQVRADAAAEILSAEELATKELQAQLAQEPERIKLERIRNELKKRGLELNDEEWEKINAQLELQGKLNREIKARPSQKQIKDQGDELERQFKRAQMTLAGQGRDLFIQDELDKAEKIARDAKFELTDGQRNRITDNAGKLFDLREKMQPTLIQPPQNQVFTDRLLRMGGQIGTIRAQTATANYDKITAEKITTMEQKIGQIYDKLPTRTELANGGTF